MAGSIPNKDKGIIATIDAHVLGQSIDAVGGYFTALTVGDKGILDKNLDSKIKGATGFKCAAFFTRLWIEHNAVIFFDVLVDATTGAKGNPAGIISSQIRAEQTKILFNGTVGAYQTTLGTTGAGNQDVLTSVTVKGQIWRSMTAPSTSMTSARRALASLTTCRSSASASYRTRRPTCS